MFPFQTGNNHPATRDRRPAEREARGALPSAPHVVCAHNNASRPAGRQASRKQARKQAGRTDLRCMSLALHTIAKGQPASGLRVPCLAVLRTPYVQPGCRRSPSSARARATDGPSTPTPPSSAADVSTLGTPVYVHIQALCKSRRCRSGSLPVSSAIHAAGTRWPRAVPISFRRAGSANAATGAALRSGLCRGLKKTLARRGVHGKGSDGPAPFSVSSRFTAAGRPPRWLGPGLPPASRRRRHRTKKENQGRPPLAGRG